MARRHTVKPGDDIPSLSARFKFRSWKSIWEHPDNDELKGLRGDPSMLNPGDRVSIPAPNWKGIDKSSEQTHRFKLRSEKVRICLVMKDREDAPIAFRPYVLSIDGKQIAEASTDSKGKIEHEIAASATEGELDFAPDPDLPDLRLKWKLKLGWMNPVESVWGIQERLRNLGYNCGPVDGKNGKLTKGALQMYEKDKGREPRGELTDQIRNELLEQHDKGGA